MFPKDWDENFFPVLVRVQALLPCADVTLLMKSRSGAASLSVKIILGPPSAMAPRIYCQPLHIEG
jgi:hypothetical protein